MSKHCGNCTKEVDFDVTSCPNCGYDFAGMGRGPTADIEERLSGSVIGTVLLWLTTGTLLVLFAAIVIGVLL